MKKKVIVLILAIFLSFTFISLSNSNISIISNRITVNSPSKISTSETAKTAWTANGTPIAIQPQYQERVDICSDGAGGAIITWEDYRTGTNVDVYAQRIRADGSVAWTPGGVAICTHTSDQFNVRICSDGSRGAIISWYDFRAGNGNIYAQKINSSGVVQWTLDGAGVCTWTGNQYYQEMCSDGAGGAIIAWYDDRVGSDTYAQRIKSNGALDSDWPAGGILVTSYSTYYPQICSDGVGGAIIAFYSTIGNIYAQRVNSSGDLQWTSAGITICDEADWQQNPQLISDGAEGAIITWEDFRSTTNFDIYARKINAAGGVEWLDDGEAICTLGTNQWKPQICADGMGGAIITWYDSDISAQRINSAGNVQWKTDGVEICNLGGDQIEPQICSSKKGSAIITWLDNRTGPNSDIYAQKISSSGAAQWTANGTLICNADGFQALPKICSDGAGGAIIAWDDERTGTTNDDIYAQRIKIPEEEDYTLLLISAVLSQSGGLLGEILGFFDRALSILLSPMVVGSIVLVETLLIIILSSVVKRQRKSSGKSKKA